MLFCEIMVPKTGTTDDDSRMNAIDRAFGLFSNLLDSGALRYAFVNAVFQGKASVITVRCIATSVSGGTKDEPSYANGDGSISLADKKLYDSVKERMKVDLKKFGVLFYPLASAQ